MLTLLGYNLQQESTVLCTENSLDHHVLELILKAERNFLDLLLPSQTL